MKLRRQWWPMADKHCPISLLPKFPFTSVLGVVPEIASRKHMENIIPVLQQALDQAEVALEELDAVAVTYGPGLVPSGCVPRRKPWPML